MLQKDKSLLKILILLGIIMFLIFFGKIKRREPFSLVL